VKTKGQSTNAYPSKCRHSLIKPYFETAINVEEITQKVQKCTDLFVKYIQDDERIKVFTIKFISHEGMKAGRKKFMPPR